MKKTLTMNCRWKEVLLEAPQTIQKHLLSYLVAFLGFFLSLIPNSVYGQCTLNATIAFNAGAPIVVCRGGSTFVKFTVTGATGADTLEVSVLNSLGGTQLLDIPVPADGGDTNMNMLV